MITWRTSGPSVFFFFQAEDGIRDIGVTGVQTCALPICKFACCTSREIGSVQHANLPSADVIEPGTGPMLLDSSLRWGSTRCSLGSSTSSWDSREPNSTVRNTGRWARTRTRSARVHRSDVPRVLRSDLPRVPRSDHPRVRRSDLPRVPRSDLPRSHVDRRLHHRDRPYLLPGWAR